MLIHNAVCDRESEPRAVGARRKEGIKDFLHLLVEYSDALILNLEDHNSSVNVCSEHEVASSGHGLDGIYRQVEQDLLNLLRIDQDFAHINLGLSVNSNSRNPRCF